jgi:hypothetical protein
VVRELGGNRLLGWGETLLSDVFEVAS